MNSAKPAIQTTRGELGAPRPEHGLRYHLGWVTSLFLVGLGARLWLIFNFGTSLPFLDQWDGEAGSLFLPYFEGRLSWGNFFRAHNEHRSVFTRVYNLCVLLLNGQWDNRLEMTLNAILYSAAVAAFGWFMARLMGWKCWPLIWLPLAAILVLPFAWENTLAGFFGFHLLLIVSLLTIWLLGQSQPWSVRWWFGVLAAVGSLFTMCSGFLVCSAVVALVALDVWKQRRFCARHLPTLAICLLVGIAGLLLKPDVPSTHNLQARTVSDFFLALESDLAWPRILYRTWARWNLLPLILLGWMYLKSDETDLTAERIILGMGVWVVLQSMARAYARGAGGMPPVPRYMDTDDCIMIFSSLSIVLLVTRYRHRLWFPWFWTAAGALWMIKCAAGLQELEAATWANEIPERASYFQVMWLRTTRGFLATDDPRILRRQPSTDIVYPVPDKLVRLLHNQELRRILPACIRDPLEVVPDEKGSQVFVRDACATTTFAAPNGPSWSSQGKHSGGKFESLPVRASALPYLEFPVTGFLGEPGLSLELVDLATGRTIPVKGPAIAPDKWVSVYAKAPAGKFIIRAIDESENRWFAFKEPREVGRLSFWAVRLLASWKYVLWAGIGCLGLNAALLCLFKRLQ